MTGMSSVDVVFAVNEAYVPPLATCINSIGQATAFPESVRLHVLHAALSPGAIYYLTKIADALGMRINCYAVPTDVALGFPVSGHVTSETYLRLFAANFLNDTDRFVYLDSDTLVLADLRMLASFNLGGAHLAAVAHPALRTAFFASERGIPTYAQHGIEPGSPVFNAGVMVVDAHLWRRDEIAVKAAAYLRANRKQVRWWDQDALNVILNRKWAALPPRWNVMTSQYHPPFVPSEMTIGLEEYRATIDDPAIIHYTSASKPWMRSYGGLFGDLWREADISRLRTFPLGNS